MKILPKHDSLGPVIYAVFCLGIVLVLFFPYLVAFSFKIHDLFLALALLLAVMPRANRRIPTDATSLKRLPFIASLGFTFLIQITLVMAFYTLCHLTAVTLAVNIAPFALFESTAHILLLDWGLFPWGLYALIAAGLSYISTVKKQPGDMSTLFRPLIRNKVADGISVVVDASIKTGIMFSLAVTLGLIGMECMGLIGALFHLPIGYGFRLDILLAMLLLLQSTKSDFFKDKLSRLLKHTSPILSTTSFLLLAILVFLILSTLIGWLSPIFTPPLNRDLNLTPDEWPAIWVIFSGMWWLTWAPLAAGMIAYVWRGYKMRTVILSTLLLPVTAGILERIYPNWHLPISLTTHWLNLIPAVLSGGVIIGLFFRTSVITSAWKAVVPTPLQDYKRSPKSFLKRLLPLMIVFMALYWAGGIYIPGMLYFIALISTALLVCTAGIAVFKAGKVTTHD